METLGPCSDEGDQFLGDDRSKQHNKAWQEVRLEESTSFPCRNPNTIQGPSSLNEGKRNDRDWDDVCRS